MTTKTNKIVLLICSISLFFPLALSAVQNTQFIDSLIISGKESFENGRSDHATHILLRAQELAEDIQDNDQLQSIDKLLAEIYEKQGDYRSANIYLRKLQNIQDSQFLLQLEKIHFYEQDDVRPIKHQTYIEKLEIAKKNQLILSFILLFVILFISFIIIIIKDKHSKKLMQLIIDEQIHSLREKNLQLDKEMKEKGISEEKFKTIFNSSTDSIVIFDIKDLSIVYFNNRACELNGYTREEFKQLTIEDLSSSSMFSVDSPEAKLYEEKMLNGEVVFIEWKAKKKSGEIFWQDIQAKISLIDGEKRMLIFARDITDRKKAEEDLDRFFNLSSDMLCISGFDGYAKRLNPAFEKILGFSNDEILSRPFIDFVHPDDRAATITELQKLNSGAISVHFEQRCRCKDGSYKWLAWANSPAVEEGLMYAVAHDITENKKADQALKKSKALLQSLIYNLPVSFYARDKKGLVFVQSAKSIEKWGDQKGMGVDDVGIDDHIKKIWGKWAENAFKGQLVEEEYQLILDDKIHYFRAVIAPIKMDNEIIGIVGVDIDVTEVKENEKKLLLLKDDLESIVETEIEKRKNQYELLIQKSKLESLGQLAAGIAHEVNQPIGLIALGLDNISERLKSGSEVSEEYIKEKIDKIFKYIERVHQIIGHISTFSRDQKDIIFDEVNINNVIEQALYMIRIQYEDHDIHFDLHFGNLLPSILGNSYKIEQVILNLLSNSYDALETKSIDNIEFQKAITIKTFQKGKYVFIEFNDNGIGMSPKEIKNIFDPFYTTKGPDKGTGLGLSISYGILQEMNAEISVKSKPNKFTTFTIKFQSC